MKAFMLLIASENANSFGLRGYVLVARDGEAWEVGSNDLNAPRPGRPYGVIRGNPRRCECGEKVLAEGELNFAAFGWEIPRRLPDAPASVVEIAWRKTDAKA